MTNLSPYDLIINKMKDGYPNSIPMVDGKVSDAFREYIRLMFTPEEAEIAQHLETKPLSAITISKRLGIDRKETKRILDEMVEKGIIQDIGGYSFFLTVVHLLNIGFKYSKAYQRLGKKGAELYQRFFIEDKFYKRYESSDAGTPLTRVIPIEKSIAYSSEILNAEEIHGILENCQKPIVVTDCPCRNRMEELGMRECKDKYPIHESCLQLGAFGNYFLQRGEGRELTLEEAHAVVENYAKLGLVFTTENSKMPNHQVICCCCACCCSLLRGMTRFKDKNENCVSKSNYISIVDPTLCKGCKLCTGRCPFNAIMMKNDKSSVDPKKCYGCGVCAVTCPTGAIKIHREERSTIPENILELMDKIHRENRRDHGNQENS
jgi:ferredoxin